MPKYNYECPGEEVVVELTLPIDHEQPRCATCGADLRRVFIAPAVHFKGNGFYKTDNK